ncbi:MAG: CRTAC1 family protein, partial [Planctomycetes bacterium]|nr:CRTAC1 family protein [Planctomycetota bacterium]
VDAWSGVDGGEAWGTGACFADVDVDGDGDLDLYVCNMEAPNRLYENRGDGTFVENAAKFGLDICAASTMAAFADYDRDGRLDLYLLTNRALHAGWARTPEVLRGFRPPADTRRKVTEMVPSLEDQRGVDAAAMRGELRGDGDLPQRLREHFLVFRGRRYGAAGQPDRLLRNVGGRFVDVTASAGIADHSMGLSATWWDYDGDGYQDLYVANDLESPDVLYQNQGDGTFRDVAAEKHVEGPTTGFGTWWFDFDNDGNLDLFAASYTGRIDHLVAHYLGRPLQCQPLSLFRNDGQGGFRDIAAEVGLAIPMLPMGANFGDLDNDGFLDFYLGTGDPEYESLMPNVMFLNRGGKQFVDVTMAGGFGHLQKGHGIAFCDLDHDGDLDVYAQMGGAFYGDRFHDALFENPGFGNHWLAVDLVGVRSNRSAIGARLCAEIEVSGQRRKVFRHVCSGGSFGCNPLRQTLGLGKATRVLRLSVWWPRDGNTQVFENLEVDRVVRIREGSAAVERVELRRGKLGG